MQGGCGRLSVGLLDLVLFIVKYCNQWTTVTVSSRLIFMKYWKCTRRRRENRLLNWWQYSLQSSWTIILYELNPIGPVGTNDRTTAEIQWFAPLVQKTRVQDHLFIIILWLNCWWFLRYYIIHRYIDTTIIRLNGPNNTY